MARIGVSSGGAICARVHRGIAGRPATRAAFRFSKFDVARERRRCALCRQADFVQ